MVVSCGYLLLQIDTLYKLELENYFCLKWLSSLTKNVIPLNMSFELSFSSSEGITLHKSKDIAKSHNILTTPLL